MFIRVAKNVEAVLNGELVAAVNMPSISGDVEKLKPYISIGEKLGNLLSGRTRTSSENRDHL